jgi:hypothetical protein
MKPHSNPARGKAVAGYAYPVEDGQFITDVPPRSADLKSGWFRPVAVCSLSPAENEARVELAAKALFKENYLLQHLSWSVAKRNRKDIYRRLAHAALLAVGVIAAPEKGEKK